MRKVNVPTPIIESTSVSEPSNDDSPRYDEGKGDVTPPPVEGDVPPAEPAGDAKAPAAK